MATPSTTRKASKASTPSTTPPVVAPTWAGQAATAAQVAAANGWAVTHTPTAPTGTPASAHNWGNKQGGTATGYLVATHPTHGTVVLAVFTGRNGHAGRLAYAGYMAPGAAKCANLGTVAAALAALAGVLPTSAPKGQAPATR